MPSPFLSSEEYDERAHQLYNEGNYDGALETLREGLALYPNAVELHIGVGYARLARDEFAWARKCFEEALVLDPDHEDALAGLGETLLKFGQQAPALKSFTRILELGYQDDVELLLQVARVLFRENLLDDARQFLEVALQQTPDNAEAVAMIGYIEHRLSDDAAAIETLRRALKLDSEHAEARIYLANLLYDRGEFETALYHFERTVPEEHWDELGIWRLIELRKSTYRLADDDASLRIWDERVDELAGEIDSIDQMLGEIEQRAVEADARDARVQLELFGTLLAELSGQKEPSATHSVVARDGREYSGTWDEIVTRMRDDSTLTSKSVIEYMQQEARRGFSLTGVLIPAGDCEAFVRGSADAGLLRILS
ncbi:MAG: tetratricopeptide repeat protein [Gemmatimonadetes bacterium]|nr:tetratricopeptide repeat protein [Gemmatimonadota bacterium]